jgi:hypothetical protein
MVQSMTVDQQRNLEGHNKGPEYSPLRVDWYQQDLSLSEFVSRYPQQSAYVKEEARRIPVNISLGLLCCNLLRCQTQQLDSLDETARLFSPDPRIQAAYIAPRKEAVQLAHGRAIFMMVDATRSAANGVAVPGWKFHFRLGLPATWAVQSHHWWVSWHLLHRPPPPH